MLGAVLGACSNTSLTEQTHAEETADEVISVLHGKAVKGDINNVSWWAEICDHLIGELVHAQDELAYYRQESDGRT